MVYGSPDVTTKYAYDGDQVIEEYDVNNTRLRRYFYGPNIDEPLAMIDHTGGNKLYYYHFDPLGSVVALSDVNGILVERYEYDVYGKPTIYDANDSVISQSSVGNPYMFTGRRYDTETGLYYYRARYYAPEIGRFLESDPMGYWDGLNLYTYLGNDPINRIDPLGLFFPGQGMMTDRKPPPGSECCKKMSPPIHEILGMSAVDCANMTLADAYPGLGTPTLIGGGIGVAIGGSYTRVAPYTSPIGMGLALGAGVSWVVALANCESRFCLVPGRRNDCGECE